MTDPNPLTAAGHAPDQPVHPVFDNVRDLVEWLVDGQVDTETLIAQVAVVSRKLEDELERGDYVAARVSLDVLIPLCGRLNDPIDDATDPAERNPLIDVYEAAVELRIRAQTRIGPADA